jgi:7-cyano-7-deazaguanine synthase in queuosine biosynthesis
MPYGWIKPEIFMTYKGVNVYRVYENDDIEVPRDGVYSLDVDAMDGTPDAHINIDALESLIEEKGLMPDEIEVAADDDNEHCPLIRIALENGLIVLPKGVAFEEYNPHIMDLTHYEGGCPYPDCNCEDVDDIRSHIGTFEASEDQRCPECGRKWTSHFQLERIFLEDV